ncbi:MAG TPA: TetR/AcrR family transcriptional regulator [Azospirillaceae bacterium]|nr:TetR/AcrR family transcriptional regulator [Azospirillaceae bacterium]
MSAPEETAPRGRAAAGRSARTRDAIVDLAIRLFNEGGVAKVTTNHIAAAAGISPGNLYYHFRNKEEIVRAAYGRFGEEADALLSVPPEGEQAPAAELLRRYPAGTFAIISRYRFFFEDMAELCRRDEALADDLRRLQRRFVARLKELLLRLRGTGLVLPGTPEAELEMLADNVWLVSRGWMEFAANAEVPEPTEQAVRRGVAHIFALVRPCLSPVGRTALDRILAEG